MTCLARLTLIASSLDACKALLDTIIQYQQRLPGHQDQQAAKCVDVVALADIVQVYGQQLQSGQGDQSALMLSMDKDNLADVDQEKSQKSDVNDLTEMLFAQLTPGVHLERQQTALLCITRLALSGLIKVRPSGYARLLRLISSPSSSLAAAVEDVEKTIKQSSSMQGLPRLFFTELAAKDNNGAQAIYNLLPHVLFDKSSSQEKEEEQVPWLENGIRFLISFLHRVLSPLIMQSCTFIFPICLFFRRDKWRLWVKGLPRN